MWVADWELVCILQLAYMTLWHLTIAYAFRNPALSVTKCRYLQSLLRCVKSNALRLNEISCTDLLQMALLTFTRLVINRAHNINIHPSDTTPLLGSQAFHGWCKRILSTEDITHFTSPHSECNAAGEHSSGG